MAIAFSAHLPHPPPFFSATSQHKISQRMSVWSRAAAVRSAAGNAKYPSPFSHPFRFSRVRSSACKHRSSTSIHPFTHPPTHGIYASYSIHGSLSLRFLFSIHLHLVIGKIAAPFISSDTFSSNAIPRIADHAMASIALAAVRDTCAHVETPLRRDIFRLFILFWLSSESGICFSPSAFFHLPVHTIFFTSRLSGRWQRRYEASPGRWRRSFTVRFMRNMTKKYHE